MFLLPAVKQCPVLIKRFLNIPVLRSKVRTYSASGGFNTKLPGVTILLKHTILFCKEKPPLFFPTFLQTGSLDYFPTTTTTEIVGRSQNSSRTLRSKEASSRLQTANPVKWNVTSMLAGCSHCSLFEV